jgi:hypothetical protein
MKNAIIKEFLAHQEKGAKVISQKFLGDGPQRTHGLPFCKNDWILNLDADEFLDKDAKELHMSGFYHFDAVNLLDVLQKGLLDLSFFLFHKLSDNLVAGGLNAGKLVKDAAKLIQGGGGGQAHFATAGGKNVDGLHAAVDKVIELAGI